MAWRIVKQPNGLYARFSDVVDSFTHMNMKEAQAFEVCLLESDGDEVVAKRKFLAGMEDWMPWTCKPSADGLSRWRDSLGTIGMRHGESALNTILTELNEYQQDGARKDNND